MTEDYYNPKTLGNVSSVEIVRLDKLDVDRVSQYMQNAKHAPSIIIQGNAANEIAKLWRSLTSGHQSRCHFPAYGLRFYWHEAIILEASICWKCNNVFGVQHGEPFHYEFDGSAPDSVQLLSLLKQSLPLESV